MSGDVVFKVAKVGLPIVASIAAALSSGIAVAKAANLTLVEFVRGKRMNIYSVPKKSIARMVTLFWKKKGVLGLYIKISSTKSSANAFIYDQSDRNSD
jgi:hypothetical protein